MLSEWGTIDSNESESMNMDHFIPVSTLLLLDSDESQTLNCHGSDSVSQIHLVSQ